MARTVDERSITDSFQSDHERLDTLLCGVTDSVGTGGFDSAAAAFAEFRAGLNHHIDAEEQVLFPAFERLTGETGGPTVVMRAEHVEIRECMALTAAALEQRDAAGYERAHKRLIGVLTDHNMKEECILYPATDEMADAPARAEIIRSIQS